MNSMENKESKSTISYCIMDKCSISSERLNTSNTQSEPLPDEECIHTILYYTFTRTNEENMTMIVTKCIFYNRLNQDTFIICMDNMLPIDESKSEDELMMKCLKEYIEKNRNISESNIKSKNIYNVIISDVSGFNSTRLCCKSFYINSMKGIRYYENGYIYEGNWNDNKWNHYGCIKKQNGSLLLSGDFNMNQYTTRSLKKNEQTIINSLLNYNSSETYIMINYETFYQTSKVEGSYDDPRKPRLYALNSMLCYLIPGKRIKAFYHMCEPDFTEGSMNNTKYNGSQLIYLVNGDIVQCNWVNNRMTGKGKLWNIRSHKLVYEGEWISNRRYGYGIYYFNNNTRYEGEWDNDSMHGKGKLYDSLTNTLLYEGEWNRDRETNGKHYEKNSSNENNTSIQDPFDMRKLSAFYSKLAGVDITDEDILKYLHKEKNYYDDDIDEGIDTKKDKLIFDGILKYLNSKDENDDENDDESLKDFKKKYNDPNNNDDDIKMWRQINSLTENNGLENFEHFLNNNDNDMNSNVSDDNNESKFRYEGQMKNGKRNGKGKLYLKSTNMLVAEGDYKNDQLNGQGKVYFFETGVLIYEGGFKNGKCHGKGKSYDEVTLKIVYEGDFVDGDRCGKGKLYNSDNGKLIYEGDYRGNHYNGFGVYYDDAWCYVGHFKNSKRWGKGKFYTASKSALLYDGEWVDDKRNGKAITYDETTHEVTYRGKFKNNMRDGFGIMYIMGHRLEGIFKDNVPEGKCKFYEEASGDLVYEGGFYNGKFNGFGIMYDYAQRYEGEFKDGKKNGKGKQYIPSTNTLICEGDFKDDQFDGQGKLYSYKTHQLIYEGGMKKDKQDGYGIYYGDTYRYEGEWKNNRYNGKGKMYRLFPERLDYDGEWKDDKHHGHGINYFDKYSIETTFENGVKNGICKIYDIKTNELLCDGLCIKDKIIVDPIFHDLLRPFGLNFTTGPI